MKTDYLSVGDDDWGVLVIYDFDVNNDYDDLCAIMQTFGLNLRNVKKSLNILSSYNTGMSISRDDIRMSVLFISQATSPSQFWNTLNHELYHATTAIIDYYGEPYDKEPAAYLHGELMKIAVETLGEPCY